MQSGLPPEDDHGEEDEEGEEEGPQKGDVKGDRGAASCQRVFFSREIELQACDDPIVRAQIYCITLRP